MDPTLHTIIATGLIAIAHFVGLYLGKREGEIKAWSHFMFIMKARELRVEEDGSLTVIMMDGTEKRFGDIDDY